MKTNFTLVRKTVLFICLSLVFSKSFSLNNITVTAVTNLKVSVINNNLIINWDIPADIAVNYCEVQSSKDGKTFTTIGYVMGASPKQDSNTFMFKQQVAKLKPGQIYYRVLNVSPDEKAVSSDIVKINP